MKLPLLLLLLRYALAAVVASQQQRAMVAPCTKPSKADIVWLVDSTVLAPNELRAVAGLIQAVGEEISSEGGLRMGYVDSSPMPRLKVDVADVVDYGKQLPEMRDATAALESEIFAKSRPGITRILILLSMDAHAEPAAVRARKANQDVLILLLRVGGAAAPHQDFADFVFKPPTLTNSLRRSSNLPFCAWTRGPIPTLL